MGGDVQREADRLLKRNPPAWNNYLEAAQLLGTCLPQDDFNQFVQESIVPVCRDAPNDSTLSVINYAHQIHVRTAFVRGLFVSSYAPEWADPSTGGGFESMRGLAGGALQGQSTWIDPLFACFFPWMFGVGIARGGSGLIAIGFGQALPYRPNLLDGELDSLIRADLLQGDVSLKAPPTPSLTPSGTLAAVEWWTTSMSQLLSVVLDPANHADHTNRGAWRTAEPPRPSR